MARQRAGSGAPSPAESLSPPVAPLIVIGAPTSGTGLAARVLRAARVHLGADCDAAGESAFFRSCNERLLAAAGAPWNGSRPFPTVLDDEEQIDALAARARGACISGEARRYLGWRRWLRGGGLGALVEPWGWVDPRNLGTLPVWLRVFPGARVVNLYRNGAEVAARLAGSRRDPGRAGGEAPAADGGLEPEAAFALWVACVEAGLRVTEALPPRQVRDLRYEALVARPERSVRELLAFAGLAFGEAETARCVAAVEQHREESTSPPPDPDGTGAWRDRARAWAEHPLMRRLEYGPEEPTPRR